MIQLPRLSRTFLMTCTMLLILATSSFASTIFVHKAAYAQNSNTGFGDTTYLAVPNGNSIPIKYVINTGKLLGVVLDKSRATLNVLLSSTSGADNNGNLTIQIPRDVLDNKKEGNADAPFRVHV